MVFWDLGIDDLPVSLSGVFHGWSWLRRLAGLTGDSNHFWWRVDRVEEPFPLRLPGPLRGQMEPDPAARGRDTRGHVDDFVPDARGGGFGKLDSGQSACGAGKVERHDRCAKPGRVRVEIS